MPNVRLLMHRSHEHDLRNGLPLTPMINASPAHQGMAQQEWEELGHCPCDSSLRRCGLEQQLDAYYFGETCRPVPGLYLTDINVCTFSDTSPLATSQT